MSLLSSAMLWLGGIGVVAAAIAWGVEYQRSRDVELELMTDEQRDWYEAELEYRNITKEAEKDHAATEKAEAKNVKKAQKNLRTAEKVGSRWLSSLGAIRLYENRVEIGDISFSFEQGPLETSLDTTLPSKTGNKQDPGSVAITVSGSKGSASAKVVYSKLKSAQNIASLIEVSSKKWPELKITAAKGVEGAAVFLRETVENQGKIVGESSSRLAEVVSDRSAIEATRSKLETAFCTRCNCNVSVSDDRCPYDHEDLLEYRPDNYNRVRATERSVRGERFGQIALTASAVIFLIGIWITPNASSSPATSVSNQAEETSEDEETKERKVSTVYEVITSTETIEFKTIRNENGDRKVGEKTVIKPGKNGIRKVTYKAFDDGRKEYEPYEIIIEPISEVVEVGIKTQTQFDADAKYAEALTLINRGDFIGANAKLQEAINLVQLPAALTKKAEIAPQLAAAQKTLYKQQCQKLPYNKLEKDADKLIGTKVYYYGEIFSIQAEAGVTILQVYVTNMGWDIWTDQVMVVYFGDIDVYKDDKINFWGEVAGKESYKSVAGWNMSAPNVFAEYIEK